jgi:hypothetical protein
MSGNDQRKPEAGNSWVRFLMQIGPAWITAITGILALGIGVGVGYAARTQKSNPTPTVTVTYTPPNNTGSPSPSPTPTTSIPGSGQGGVIRKLSVPFPEQGAFMSIDFDTGQVQVSGGGSPAYYKAVPNTNIPELQINAAFSLDVNPANAGKSQCSTVANSSPNLKPITKLKAGTLICVQGNSGVALLEITKNVTSSATTLHLRETYWPSQP